jgi:hypothetical protein
LFKQPTFSNFITQHHLLYIISGIGGLKPPKNTKKSSLKFLNNVYLHCTPHNFHTLRTFTFCSSATVRHAAMNHQGISDGSGTWHAWEKDRCKPQGMKSLGRSKSRQANIKMDCKETLRERVHLMLTSARRIQCTVKKPSEHGNEPSGSEQTWRFLNIWGKPLFDVFLYLITYDEFLTDYQ